MYDVVILAGGYGTRLKSISGDIPKPMVDISGKPFLYRLMEYVESQGVKRIVLSLSYEADYIIKRVTMDNPVKCEVDFVVEKNPLGTGGGIKYACSKVNTEKFIVLNGDTYCELNYQEFISASYHSDLLISGVEVDDVSRYGSLDIDEDFNVNAVVEKGKKGKGVINSGIYILSKENIQNYPLDSFSFEQDLLPTFKGRFKAFISKAYFIDIGIPDDYYLACEKFK
ncbi:hypothetical protein BTJ39_22065 [Izhakiella australiensis]|uniref:Nucleotidyl transferase domain-containing protein n=1 Tax=Izhakiella australiensis TaxID=1926881 RepID=A0A1S8Y9X6_9GAMM|nr:nucleotidyltransferase family protein [Izhakiella australiensis]OON35652.1 hypothetical protein BTJ39_22065 [Izhakiella australiensis]